MPMYEYVCHDCDKEFSLVQSIHEHEASMKVTCAACGGGNVERRFSAVAVETPRKS